MTYARIQQTGDETRFVFSGDHADRFMVASKVHAENYCDTNNGGNVYDGMIDFLARENFIPAGTDIFYRLNFKSNDRTAN